MLPDWLHSLVPKDQADDSGESYHPDYAGLEQRILYSAVPLDLQVIEDVESFDLSDVDGNEITFHDSTEFDGDAIPGLDEFGELNLANNVPTGGSSELIFIDGSVDDLEKLLSDEGLLDRSDAEIVLLDPDQDGIQQITQALEGRSGLAAIHFVTHGTDGQVQLGDTLLSAENLSAYAGQVSQWGSALSSSGDILFYGCDLASTAHGEEFVDSLSALCDCDVAASDDLTGHADLGGDWEFEYIVGVVETDLAFSVDVQENWNGTLASVTVTTLDDVVDSTASSVTDLVNNPGADGVISLREAIIAANANADADVIHLGAGIHTLELTGAGNNLGDLDITSAIEIVGASDGSTVIDAGGDVVLGEVGLGERVFHVQSPGETVVFRDLTIQGGTAIGGATEDQGGGVYFEFATSAELRNVTIRNNSATNDGGGILSLADQLIVTNSTFEDNESVNGEGGAVRLSRGVGQFDNVTVSGNTAEFGGGIESTGGDHTFTNLTLSGNEALAGGGIRSGSGVVTIENATITENIASAGSGGGIHRVGGGFNISGSIIAGNEADLGTSIEVLGTINSLGYNIIGDDVGDADGGFGYDTNLDLFDQEALALGVLRDNHGAVFTHELLLGSVGIDGALSSTTGTDARGFRFTDGLRDIGAFEQNATPNLQTIVVTTTADEVDGDTSSIINLFGDTGADGAISLREAIIAVNNGSGGQTILLGAGIHTLTMQGSGETGGDLDINENVQIIGLSTESSVIDGSGLFDQTTMIGERVFDVVNGDAAFQNLTITGGRVTTGNGGGINVRNSDSVVVVDNVVVSDNHSLDSGGGIANSGTLTVTNSTVSLNTAGSDGAGIFSNSSRQTELHNVTVSGNITGDEGGGVFLINGSHDLTNVTLSGNFADDGGGIAFAGTNLTNINLTHVTIADNTAHNDGGGIFSRSAQVNTNVEATIVARNNGPNDVSGSISGTNNRIGTLGLSLGVLADNGGPVQTHALLPGSNAINGTGTAAPGETDARGFLVTDGNRDIGAFEVTAPQTSQLTGLLVSTANDITGSAAPGLNEWDNLDVIRIGDPDLAIENGDGFTGTSDGTFSEAIDFQAFADAATPSTTSIDALHQVGTHLTFLGVDLQPGDVLFSTSAETTYTSNNSVTLSPANVHLFRPDTPGDYSAGDFTEDVVDFAALGISSIRGFTLVETDTNVGGQALSAGDFLHLGTGPVVNVNWYDSSAVGLPASSVLVDGAGIGIQSAINSIELIETAHTSGDTILDAGTLLLTTTSGSSTSFPFGSNNIIADSFDVVAFNLSSTGMGTTAGTASIVFDGSDVGLTSVERFNSLSLETVPDVATVDGGPTIDLSSGIELNNDGGNDAYLISNAGLGIPLTATTFEILFSATDTPDETPFLSFNSGVGTNDEFSIQTDNSGALELDFGDGSLVFTSGTNYADALLDGERHSLAVTWDSASGDWEIYIDGQFEESGSNLNQGEQLDTTNGQFVFGQDQDGPDTGYESGQQFSGTIYDVRIWDGVRNATEIADNYQQKLDPNDLPSGLVANWQFDGFDNSGQVVEVVNGNNLSVRHVTGASGSGDFSASTLVDALNVDENSSDGTTVGFVIATSNGDTSENIFTLTNDAGGRFAIDSATGEITVANQALLNHEANQSHVVTVAVTDDAGNDYGEDFTITVNNVNEAPTFYAAETPTFSVANTPNGADSVVTADIDGDGHLDLVSAAFGEIVWHQNDGAGGFTEHSVADMGPLIARSVTVTDVDGDGHLDLVAAFSNSLDDEIFWFRNDGNENFTPQSIVANENRGASSVTTADVDGDGDIDVLVAAADGDSIKWYENDGSESFSEHLISDPMIGADGASSVITADVDGDGDLDVLSASRDDDTIAWYENDGNQTFTRQIIDDGFLGARSVTTADVDGDGTIDVLGAAFDSNEIAWFRNNGDGTFAKEIVTEAADPADGPNSVTTADIDADGDLDILSTSFRDGEVVWYENDGSQGFTANTITSAAGASSIAVGDLNNDGHLDVIAASLTDGIVLAESSGNRVNTLDDGIPPTTPEGTSVVIDDNVEIFDDELSALNGGLGNFGGATLRVQATTASTGHVFEPGGPLSFNGADFLLNGDTKGTFITGTGLIEFTFADGVTNDEVNEIMQSLRYNNTGDAPPASVDFTWTFNDRNDGSQGPGGEESAVEFSTVNINPINDEPTITGLDSNVAYTENADPVTIDNDVELFDAELDASGSYDGATLHIVRASGASSEDLLGNTGLLGQFNAGSDLIYDGETVGSTILHGGGQLLVQFNGDATEAVINGVARSITYANSSDAPPASVELAWNFNDQSTTGGGSLFDVANIQVDITAVNDAPVLDGGGLTPRFDDITEDDIDNDGELISSLLAKIGDPITDPDGIGLAEGIAIIANGENEGTWQYSIDNGATWQDVGSVSNSSALLLRNSDLLRLNPNGVTGTNANLGFRAWDQTSFDAGDRIDIAANGGTGGSSAFSLQTLSAQITAFEVNDEPTVDLDSLTGGRDYTTEFVAGGSPVAIVNVGNSSIADVDNLIEQLTVTLANFDATSETIDSATLNLPITRIDVQPGVIAFINDGTATSDDFQTLLDSLTYGNSDTSATGSRIVTIVANDGFEDSPVATTTVEFDDAPSVDLNGAATGENVSLTFTENGIPLSLAPNATVDDLGENDIVSLTLTANGLQANDEELFVLSGFGFSTAGPHTDTVTSAGTDIAYTYDPGSGTIAFTNAAGATTPIPAAALENLIHNIRYQALGDDLVDTSIDFEFVAEDASGQMSTVTSQVDVVAVNDAPIFDTSGMLTLTAVDQNSSGNPGNTVAEILDSDGSGRVTDVDGPAAGIAVSFTDSGNGSWQYSIDDGATWLELDSASFSQARLLDLDSLIRFEPNPGIGDRVASLSFGAWDQSIGNVGDSIDLATAGTSISTDADTAMITVNAVNSAPVLSNTGLLQLDGITEDDLNNNGNSVAEILASDTTVDPITDVDGDPEGIAITDLTGNGTWQFDTGTGWTDVGSVSETNALLLGESDRLRYVPDGENGETATIVFQAWDQTDGGVSGTKVDSSVSGGATSFSDQVEAATIDVSDVNDAPVLGIGGQNTLTSIDEDDFNSAGNTITDILATGLGNPSTLSDPDGDEIGIAIIGAETGNGEWEFSTDGVNWNPVGSPSSTSALLLGPDARVRFVPNPNYTGPASISYRAWDQTFGNEGQTIDPTGNIDGTGTLSNGTDTAVITVNPVNDAPLAMGESITLAEDTTFNSLNLLDNDSDPDGDVLTVVTTPIQSPINGTVILSADGSFSYTPNADFDGSDSFTYRVSDSNGGFADAVVNITIVAENDDPVITVVGSGGSVNEGTAVQPFFNDTLTDIDSPNFESGALTVSVASPDSSGHSLVIFFGNGVTVTGNDISVGGTVVGNHGGTIGSAGPLVVNFNADATSADVQAIMRQTGLVNTSEDPVAGNRIVQAVVTDGDGGTSNISEKIFDFIAINDAPTLSNNGGTVSEGGFVELDSSLLEASDVDDAATDLTYTILATSNGQLELSTVPGVEVTSFTQAQIDNREIRFVHDGSETTTASFDFILADGGEDGASPIVDTFALTVNPINDDPTAVNDAFSTDEDTTYTATLGVNDLLFNDSDVDSATLTVTTVPTSGPNDGQVTINPDGTFTYTPDANFAGTDSFTYEVTDGNGGRAEATVDITVNSINDAPVAVDDDFMVDEDGVLTLPFADLLQNDTDVEGDLLSITSFSAAANGTVTLGPGGSFIYTPNTDFNGTDFFTYTIDDGNGGTDTATVDITVNSINDAPVVDLDADDSSGTPGLDFDTSFVARGGPVPLTDGVTITDVDSSIQTLTIRITNIQDGLNEELDYTVPSSIDAVYDDDNGVLVLTNLGSASNAEFETALNSLTYRNTLVSPDTRTREVTVVANDGFEDSLVATAFVAITGDVTPPTEVNNVGSSVDEGGTDLIEAAELSYTDDQQTASDIAYSVTSTTTNGFLALTGDPLTQITNFTQADIDNNNLIYVHDGTETLSDSFTFTVNDGQSNPWTGQIFNITVLPQNDAPVNNVPGNQVTNEDTPLVFNSANGNPITISDSDAGNSLIEVTVSAANGTITLGSTAGISISNGTGTGDSTVTFVATQTIADEALDDLTFTPTADFNGGATITIMTDDMGNSGAGGPMLDSASVNITVNPINDAPTANADTFTVLEDSTITDDLLQNDSDIDGDSLLVNTTPIVGPSNGSLILNSNGTFTYTPNPNFAGSDSFTYAVSDSTGATSQAQVTLVVQPVNDEPLAVDDTYQTAEDTPLLTTLGVDDLLQNDSDLDGDILFVSLTPTSPPTNGTLTLNPDGTFNYQPNRDFTGTDSFTYEIRDGAGGIAEASVTINVTPINDAPNAIDDAYVLTSDTLTVDAASGLLSNDFDIEGDSITAQLLTQPNHGTVTINPDGSFTYVHDGSATAAVDSFEYRLVDENGGSDTGTVTIAFNTPTNDPPIASDDDYSVDEGGSISVDAALGVLSNDLDADGDLTSITLLSGPTNGTLTLNQDGSFDYSHDGSETTSDGFSYQIRDSQGATSIANVDLAITPVNDKPVGESETFTLTPGQPLEVAADNGLLANDADIDSANLQALLASEPAGGELILNADGSLSYIPDAGFFGTDSFTYVASDGISNSAAVTVFLEVPLIAPPVQSPDLEPNDDIPDDERIDDTMDEAEDDSKSKSEDRDKTTPIASDAPSPNGGLGRISQAPERGIGNTTNELTNGATDTLGLELLAVDELEDSDAAFATVRSTYVAHQLREGFKAAIGSLSGFDFTLSDTLAIEDLVPYGHLLSLQDQISSSLSARKAAFGTAVLGSAVTASYVVWSVRGGYLFATLITAAPAWKVFDPLPVLNMMPGQKKPKDDESLEELVKQSNDSTPADTD